MHRLAVIDRRLADIAAALREARCNDDLADVAICEQRLDELFDERNRIAAKITAQPDAG